MRQTPRHMRSSRGIGTLIGNGWLRESPRNAWQGWGAANWDARGRSALRKCMFMPVPDEVRAMGFGAPQVSDAALPPHSPHRPPQRPAHRPATPMMVADIVPHRRDPRKDAREFPAYSPGALLDPRVAAQQAHAAHVRNAQKVAAAGAAKGPLAWWEDPVALGSLLILFPPIGLAAVWSSKRYSNDARWALTVMTALTMCLMSAVFIAVLAVR
jgi:hypothetical protein